MDLPTLARIGLSLLLIQDQGDARNPNEPSVQAILLHLHRDARNRESGLAQNVNNHAIGVEINLPVVAGMGVRTNRKTWPPLTELKDLNVGILAIDLIGNRLDPLLQQGDRLGHISAVVELGHQLNPAERRR